MSLGEVLPTVNAILNGAAFVLLLLGFVAIRRGDRRRHHALMLSACGASALFLVSYLTRIAPHRDAPLPGRGDAPRRTSRCSRATRSSPRSPHRWCCGRSSSRSATASPPIAGSRARRCRSGCTSR